MTVNPKSNGDEAPGQPPAGKHPGQQPGGEGQEYGEGNYKATRQYNEGLKDHVQHHDIEKEARDAAPKSAEEAREMEEAERIGRSRARGSESPDDPEDEQDLVD
jgi:hypothetical protein